MNPLAQEKYSRQILLKEIGEKNQIVLNKSRVAIVGVGALGTVAAELLTRAGIENLTLIDFDQVESSNLQRQTLFTEKDLGKNKALTAKKHLKFINSRANITVYQKKLTQNNLNILKNHDLILGCTDELSSRFLLNQFCLKNKIPWIFASAVRTSGYVFPILPGGPCLNCFIKKALPLEKASTSGILNTITYSIPALQITLAIKILLKQKIESRLYYYNIWTPELKILNVKIHPNCQLH